MFSVITISGTQLVVLMVIGFLLFGHRLPQLLFGSKPLRVGLREQRHQPKNLPASVATSNAVPLWLLAVFAWFWREFYFWMIDDCE
jgi:hypothetical protein